VESIAYLVAKLPQDDRGSLTIVNVSNHRTRYLAEGVGASDMPPTSLPGEARLPVVMYGVDAGAPPIGLVDTSAGSVSNAGVGHGPVLGPGDELAYCDVAGKLVVSNLTANGELTTVADLRSFTSCVPIAWSTDGELAFAARSPLGTRGPESSLSIFTWRRGANGLREFKLPANLKSANQLSWSKDASTLVLLSDESLTSVDVSSGTISTTSWDGVPSPSMTSSSVVAVWVQGKGIAVYENGAIAASFPVTSATVGFAWDPSADRIAIATGNELVLWDWRANSSARLRSASADETILQPLVWITER